VKEAVGARVLRVGILPRDPRICRVEIDGVGPRRLDAETARRLRLEAGAEIDAETLLQIEQAAMRHEARTVAWRLLQRRLRSRAEVERALRRRNIPPDAVIAVVTELRRDGWIDDARFARSWVQDRLALRPCGPRRLRAELRARGVSTDLAEEAITTLLPRAIEDDVAMNQARARLARLRRVPPEVARRRLASWLQRRGFGGDVIARVLRTVPLLPPDQPDVDPAA
jgi:regulatory protein